MNLVFPDGTNIDLLELLQGTNSIPFLAPATKTKVHLFSSDTMTPNTNTTLAQLLAVESNFPSYAPTFINWSAPTRDGVQPWVSTAVMGEFRPSNDTFGGQTINGCFITGTGADSLTLYGSGKFDDPVPLPDSHSALNFELVFSAPATGSVTTL